MQAGYLKKVFYYIDNVNDIINIVVSSIDNVFYLVGTKLQSYTQVMIMILWYCVRVGWLCVCCLGGRVVIHNT